MRRISFFLFGFILSRIFFPGDVGAEQSGYDLGQVLVSASRVSEFVAQTGSSVRVIGREVFEQQHYSSVREALEGQLGVGVSSNSAFGGATSVYLRGAPSGHTLVLMDGARLYDPIATDASFDLANLSLDNVERIEIIKGPQSSLYGSDAIGGVVNIITRSGSGKPSLRVALERASQRTHTESLGSSGALGKFFYSFDVSRQDSRGFTKARDGLEPDEYQNSAFNGKFTYRPTQDFSVGIKSSYLRSKFDLDDGAYADDADFWSKYSNVLLTVFGEQRVNDIWGHSADFSWLRNVRKYTDDSDAYWDCFKAWSKEANWQHTLDAAKWFGLPEGISDTLVPGFQYTYETGYERSNYGDLSRMRADREGYFIENKFGYQDRFFNTLALRLDRHSRFGKRLTGRATATYLFDWDMRLKGSYGTGFKAPSLYQLYSLYGDTALQAEKSWGYDCGIEQQFFKNKLQAGVTYFHNRFRDLIEYDMNKANPRLVWWPFGVYVNRGSAKTEGVETELRWAPREDFSAAYGFTYTHARDLQTMRHLLLRPNNAHRLSLTARLRGKASVSFAVTRNVKLYDNANGNPNYRLKDYTVCDFSVTVPVCRSVELYCRIENLFDETYQQVNGYSAKRRFLHWGLKGKF